MGIIADRLTDLSIESSSPDGQMTSVFRPLSEVDIQFHGDTYRHYTERGLEHQLSALAGRWWEKYMNVRKAALAEVNGEPVPDNQLWDADIRRYLADRAESVYEGMSERQHVFVRSVGLRQWRIVVRDKTLSALDAAEFSAEVGSAFAAMMDHHHATAALLRDKHLPR